MNDSHVDVVVIGAGVVGASVAYHVAARGARVLVLEQAADIGHASTARSGAGVRHQWSSATNILLSQYSIARLHHFQEEIGADAGLRLVGYLFLVREPDTWAAYQQDAALQHRYGVPTQLLAPEDVTRFIPGTRTDDLQGAAFCAEDGYCDPLAIRNGYMARAQQLGAELRCNAGVSAIHHAHGLVERISTTAGEIACGTVVNAAGSWAGAVGALAGLDIPVKAFRRHLYVLDPIAGIPADIPFTFDADTGFYMRSAGQHLWCNKINPAELHGQNIAVDWDWMPQVLAVGTQRFPFLARANVDRVKSWAGSYEITPDHAPILGRHPALPNYVDANGFSGHGIMHSPATGMLIAEEILDGRAHTIDIDEFRVARFASASGAHERKVF